jgi:hypothetical protein
MKQFLISIISNITNNPLICLINLWGLVLSFAGVIFISLCNKNYVAIGRYISAKVVEISL